MRNTALNITGSALIILSALFFVCGLSLAEEAEYVDQPATVSKVIGRVSVRPQGAFMWKKAQVGMELSEGDKIKTGKGAKAELTFPDGSFLRMKEKTTLGIKVARQEVSTQASEYNLDFRVGEIMVEVQKLKKGSSFKVETPTSVAAVRGTTYYMRTGTKVVDGVEKSYVEIYLDSDDTLLFTNTVSGASYTVSQWQSSIVYDDGTIEEPYLIPPDQRDSFKSGFDLVYDDSKRGMRDVEEEETGDDVSGDVDDTTDNQDDAQQDADQDQTGEQDIYGLAKVDIITDSDGDGYPDDIDAFPLDPTEWLDTDGDGTGNNADEDDDGDGLGDTVDAETGREGTDRLNPDTDADTYNDFEDAFPKHTYNPALEQSYGSWAALREATLNELALENVAEDLELRQDISTMIDDIHARGYDAQKDKMFDHQAGKVMTDRWGNRVRVEEYVFKQPAQAEGDIDTMQILALNLRTAGPNAGISSLDFRVRFDEDISDTNLKGLPWDNYMDNPMVWEKGLSPDFNEDEDAQLIVYEEEPDFPLPLEFSLEVKNPLGDFVKATEIYYNEEYPGSYLYAGIIRETTQEETPVVYWYQIEQGGSLEINGTQYEEVSWDPVEDWGEGWNQDNRFTFLDFFADESKNEAWLMGVFYLINDDGSLVALPAEGDERDYLSDIRGLRDCINPDFNLEMVFLSSEFEGTLETLPADIASYMEAHPDETSRQNYIEELYRNNRTIDAITIHEITNPYTID